MRALPPLLLTALVLVACPGPYVPPPPEPFVTPLPRPVPRAVTTARPTPSPTPPASPAPPLPTASPSPVPSVTPTPRRPAGRIALDATFVREGRVAVRRVVTAAEEDGRFEQVGVTDGTGFATLVLPAWPLPAMYRLAVAGQEAGTLFLAAGRRPRVHPLAGWAVEPGLATEPR